MDIFDLIIKISSILTSIGVIIISIKKIINKTLEPLNKKINIIELNEYKNFLVIFLSRIEKKEKISESETLRAYELYDYYINVLKGNSFIKEKWERLMKNED